MFGQRRLDALRERHSRVGFLNKAAQALSLEPADGFDFVEPAGENHGKLRAHYSQFAQGILAAQYRHGEVQQDERDLVVKLAKEIDAARAICSGSGTISST